MFRLFFIAVFCISTMSAEEENQCSDRVINHIDVGGVRDVTCGKLVLKHGADLTSNIESVKEMTHFNVLLIDATGEVDESSFPKLRDEITKLNFASSKISQFVLPAMPKLKEIQISESTFPKLEADSFKNTPNLEGLTLINNVDLQNEPSPFKNLHNLKTLVIVNQQIPHFTKEWLVGLDNLEVLSLFENRLATLDEDVFENSQKLKTLELKESKLTKIQPNTFKLLKNLQKLNLLGANLEDFSLDFLSEQKELTTLGLPTKFLLKFGVVKLKEVFPKLAELEILPEDQDQLIPAGIKTLAESLNIRVTGTIILN